MACSSLAVWMRDLLGGSDDEEGFGQGAWVCGRRVVCDGQRRVSSHPLSHRLVRGEAAEHPLTASVVGSVEALQQDLEIRMAVDRDPRTSRCTRPLKRSTIPLVLGV